ncbi:tyrosine-type recombinase/integrase [Lacipirellula sp.]|uniref:tyrosine-type recombinase/integrase n=1 Tax=Lacipirellula sp. TaxID=2691419 RepID=UPI003D0CE98B
MKRAWVFQNTKQKAKLGDKCPWSVGWYDPAGKRREKVIGAKTNADRYCRKIEGEMAAGVYGDKKRVKWEEFRKQFAADGLTGRAEGTVREYLNALDSFERIIKPVYMDAVTTAAIDAFVSARAKEPGRRRIPKSQAAGAPPKHKRRKALKDTPTTSPATINKELRHLKAAFKKSVEWDQLSQTPKIKQQKLEQNDPYFIDDATLELLYDACGTRERPAERHYAAADWWRALLCFAYMTGWRIGEILDLKRADLDLEAGVAVVAAGSTKGGRTARIELHPALIYQLKTIAGMHENVFDWPHHKRTLWDEFAALKKAAGVEFRGAFHRFRFGFANANVDKLDADLLQRLMRHQDPKTTQIYINAAQRMKRAGVAEKLHAPDFLPREAG